MTETPPQGGAPATPPARAQQTPAEPETVDLVLAGPPFTDHFECDVNDEHYKISADRSTEVPAAAAEAIIKLGKDNGVKIKTQKG